MPNELSENLRSLMARKAVTAVDIEKDTEGAVRQPTISRILNKKRNPRPATLRILADYFGVTISQLLGEEPLPDIRERSEYQFDQELMDQVPPIIGDETRRMLDRRYTGQIAFRATEITDGLINERYRILYYTMLLEEKISAKAETNANE